MTQVDISETEPLTDREQEILRLIAEGLTNREIAGRLFLSPETVKWYNKQSFAKLGVSNRTEAAGRARELGLLDTAAARPKHNLPAELSSFVGRQREIAEVRSLLQTSRLVTLTGMGGTGKTRLALRIAREVAGEYGDGVAYVPLAAVTDSQRVAEKVVQELGIAGRVKRSALNTLRRHFRDKHSLLVLDNFEHLLEAAPLVTELLAAASRLTVLTTSRATLRLSGEQGYSVPPLTVPVLALDKSVKELSAYESVTLLVQRANAASPGFKLTDENAAAVAGICFQLDGLPLAIELAATRLKLFSPSQLLERLTSRLDLLKGGFRDLPARQKTLRATLDWSFALLNRDEQQLLARLSVFSAGCSLEAAEAVCGRGLEIDAVDGLHTLVDNSLLYVAQDSGREPRFHMLETVRDYAHERLAEGGEVAQMRRRHLAYYLELAETADPHLSGSDEIRWINRFEAEHENLLAALAWSQTTHGAADSGLRLVVVLGRFWGTRSYFNEGREQLSAVLSRPANAGPTAARARALRYSGFFAHMQGDISEARAFLEESVSIYRAVGPAGRRDLAKSLIALGDLEATVGNHEAAKANTSEALAIMRALEHAPGIARAYWQLGASAARFGDYEEARHWFDQALPLLRRTGERWLLAIVLSGLAEVALRLGDYARAADLEQESLALRREIGETWGIAVSLAQLGWIALLRDNLKSARELLAESLALRYEIGDVGGVSWCLEKMAEIALISGRSAEGNDRIAQAQRAARLFGAAAGLRKPLKSTIDQVDLPEYERLLADARAALSVANFKSAWSEGQTMTMEQAVAYALAPKD